MMKFFADCEVELFLQIESIFIKQNQRHSAQIRIKKKKRKNNRKKSKRIERIRKQNLLVLCDSKTRWHLTLDSFEGDRKRERERNFRDERMGEKFLGNFGTKKKKKNQKEISLIYS